MTADAAATAPLGAARRPRLLAVPATGRPRAERTAMPDVVTTADRLELQLARAETRDLTAAQRATADAVRQLLRQARTASLRQPASSRPLDWWQGIRFDLAYQSVHAAHAALLDLYDEDELDAEIPSILARARTALGADDPRCVDPAKLRKLPVEKRRALLRRCVDESFDVTDNQHVALRRFRNLVLLTAALLAVLGAVTALLVARAPSILPLCFPQEGAARLPLNCPTGSAVQGASGGDVLVVALVGLLGGALTAAVTIRSLRTSSSPYDVHVALALFKVPVGALVAIAGIVAIRAEFVPGLSVLDSQEQILAYALLLGSGQHVFTRLLDRRAQGLLDAVPSKETSGEPAGPPKAAARAGGR
jgi:hypothetical protein